MLLRSVDVLDIYVEPYIQSGFRPPNQPYSYYYRSLFSLHNETLSVWIHLLGTFVLLGQVYRQIQQLSSDGHSLEISLYLLYNCCGACAMLLFSAQAHLFHSRTLADHLRSFYLDYLGINFYGFTSGIILQKFSHREKWLVRSESHTLPDESSYYLTLSCLSLYSLSIACFCKTFYRRPYPFSHKILQCSGVLLVYFHQILPVVKSILLTMFVSADEEALSEYERKALFWHLMQILSFVGSGLIFVCKIPERFCPGLFDLCGQSHHTFHLTIFLVAYCQGNAVFEDARSIPASALPLGIVRDTFHTLIILGLQLLSVYLWFRLSRPAIERRYQSELKTD